MPAKAATEQLRTYIQTARQIVVFTGAGISTESGIPDFRSPGGLWSRMKPIQFQDFISSDEIRQESWRRRFSGERTLEDARPNRGHRAISHLVETGQVSAVITQNVDNLHQLSGVPDDKVIELHGNAHHATCLACGKRYELDDLREQFRKHERIDPCEACGGIIKTATISFGQPMPELEMRRAEKATLNCDLFLVLGSSLQVYPAAGFPEVAARRGIPLLIVNREPTPLDDAASLVIHDEIGTTLGDAVGVN